MLRVARLDEELDHVDKLRPAPQTAGVEENKARAADGDTPVGAILASNKVRKQNSESSQNVKLSYVTNRSSGLKEPTRFVSTQSKQALCANLIFVQTGDVFEDLMEKVTAFNDDAHQTAMRGSVTERGSENMYRTLKQKNKMMTSLKMPTAVKTSISRITSPKKQQTSSQRHLFNVSTPMRPQTARMNMSFTPY